MTVRALPYLLALLLGVGAAGLTACGQTKSKALISSSRAGPLKADFDAVAAAVRDHDCPGANAAIDKAQNHLVELPGTVSKRLRDKLQEGIATLREQAPKECVETESTATTEQTTTETIETTTEPVTTATETTATETVPPATTDTVPPVDTTTLPPPDTTATEPPPTTDPEGTGGVVTP